MIGQSSLTLDNISSQLSGACDQKKKLNFEDKLIKFPMDQSNQLK